MYSPSNIIDPVNANYLNHGMSDDMSANRYDGKQAAYLNNDVDSMLMLNRHSPTQNSFANMNRDPIQHNQNQSVPYRRVRPEPISEKTLVGSMVGYLHDVIGTGENFNKHSQTTKQQQQHNCVQSGSSTLLSKAPSNSQAASEIKEQIEWLHYENINLLCSTNFTSNSWNLYNNNSTPNLFNNVAGTNKNSTKFQNCHFSSSNILLVLGYKTGFSIWTINVNGVATEVLSIREPNITHVKILQLENPQKVLIAICKLILSDNDPPQLNNHDIASNENFTSSSNSQYNSAQDLHQDSQANPEFNKIPNNSEPQQTQQIAIVNLLNGEFLHEILFNGTVLDMKSNADLLCVNSWNRIDAFDLNTFEHRFSLNSCYTYVSKSNGKSTNPFALGSRWLAFADKKFHVILSSQGGVSMDIEQSYTSSVLNTAKNISKGLVKISETVANVVSKKKNSSSNCSSSDHSPRGNGTKNRHDSKEDFQPGICTILDTQKYVNNSRKSQMLHDENQNWIVAHFLAHQEALYALEFNPNGRLLVSADCLGQYFNVFQINTNSYKCTRTVVKHLYSLYRGDTTSKVRNISFSNDSRWLAIGTKRGTTHVFPINSYGGVVNARTHSKPHLVNRSAKHQRTAGFVENEEGSYNSTNSSNSNINSLLTNTNLNSSEMQQYQMQQMLQQQYDNSLSTPIVHNNNPKLRSLMEPFIIPVYGQLKQPNTNSTFQSSVLSANTMQATGGSGLLTTVNNANHDRTSSSEKCSTGTNGGSLVGLNSSVANIGANCPNIAVTALSSAALVTENMTQFGIKNFSSLATNTSNLIQYDNVQAIAIFGESRGYLSPEEPRDHRPKPVNSLFIISDVNGNLVEYTLDVMVDTSKAAGNKATNDSPILLKITPKAQWPLERFVASDEIKYPIESDNPLILNSNINNKQRNNSNESGLQGAQTNYSMNSFSPNNMNSLNSLSSYQTAPNSLVVQPSSNDEWIKQIEISTHIGPHRRLFMGPQFVFKTFNSNLTTTKLTSNSSSVISDVETPIIDLSGDIELNTLDLTLNSNASSNIPARDDKISLTQPVKITHSLSKTLKAQQKFDCTPTFIEVGAGSFQEGMPVLCGSQGSRGSQKSLNKDTDLLTESIAESLAEAMNDLNTTHQQNIPFNQRILQQNKSRQMQHPVSATNVTPAIAITNNLSQNISKANQPHPLLINTHQNSVPTIPILAPSSLSSNNSVFTPGSYFMINQSLSGASNIDTTINSNANNHQNNQGPNLHHTSSTSFTSSGSSSSNNSSNMNNEDDNSGISSNSSSIHNSLSLAKRGIDLNEPYHRSDAPSLENIQFHDDINLLH